MTTLFTGLNCIELQSVDSTNNYAANLIKQTNVTEGTVILAHDQFSGRGQRGASWHSESGKNLTFSVIFKPAFLSVSEQFMLSKICALSLYALLSKYIQNVKIKWPNDILCVNKKIAGTLIENILLGNSISYSIMGIGININQADFATELNATSLSIESKKEYDLKHILTEFCSILESYYLSLRNGMQQKIDTEYLNHLFGLNEWATFMYLNTRLEAMIIGISKSGLIELKMKDGKTFFCDIKELKFLL